MDLTFPFAEGPGVEPPVEYAGIHATGLPPVTLPGGHRAMLVSRHEDVRTVLSDPRFSRAAFEERPMAARDAGSLSLLLSDPPEHTRRRGTVTAAFSANRIERMRPRLEGIAGRMVERLRAAGSGADLVEAFAVPFPLAVMCDLLGIPEAAGHRFRPWVNAMMSTSGYPPDEVAQAQSNLHAAFADLIEEAWRDDDARRPPAGLLARLGRQAEWRISRHEAIVLSAGLLIAGYETTSNQLAVFLYLLLREPDRWLRLRDNPGEIPRAVEEMARFTSFFATGGVPHVATEDVRLSAGVIKAGEVAVPLIDAANRDPGVFDDPACLRIGRSDNPHLAFGYGRHFCLGAQLARVELQVGIACLLRELPDLRLARPESQLPWRRGMFIRGLWQLPVRWTDRAGEER